MGGGGLLNSKESAMRTIKKYANRKLYDTIEKKYLSLDRIAELIRGGEEIEVIDNRTGKDITASVLSGILSKEKEEKAVSPRLLTQLLRKGSGTLADYARKYAGLWQNAVTMAEDEIDRLVARMVRDREISSSEGGRLKRDIIGYTESLRNWISDKIDQRVHEVFNAMNLVTRDQLRSLEDRLAAVEKRLARVEDAAARKGEKSPQRKTHSSKQPRRQES
jgi:polyhydroxyalkanoate synthesis repressor PhaR